MNKPTTKNNGALQPGAPLRGICLDAEMADGRELLELSVFDDSETEIYHQLFRPHRRSWHTDIHHITPQMVADAPRASACAPEIARIVKEADVIVGCAIDNDLRQLSEIGVNLSMRQQVVDIQHLHFYIGGGRGGTLFNMPALLTIAEAYGVEFSSEEAHGATADTRATLRCLYAMMDIYYSANPPAPSGRADVLADAVRLEGLARAELASGYVVLSKREKGYQIEVKYMEPREKEDTVSVIRVADRYIAEYELRRRFAPRTVPGLARIYRLGAADLRYFRNYTCEHDPARSASCRALSRGL